MNYVINLRKKKTNHAVFTRMCSICNELKIPTDYRNDDWGNFNSRLLSTWEVTQTALGN